MLALGDQPKPFDQMNSRSADISIKPTMDISLEEMKNIQQDEVGRNLVNFIGSFKERTPEANNLSLQLEILMHSLETLSSIDDRNQIALTGK